MFVRRRPVSTIQSATRKGALWLLVPAWLGLGACATGPELKVEHAPEGVHSFASIDIVAADSDAVAAKAVVDALKAKAGVSQGDEWQMVVALAVRSATVGTAEDVLAREGVWTETPRPLGAKRGPGLHVLTVVATRKDGTDRRVARVSARGPVDRTPDELLALMADNAAKLLLEGGESQ